jgi:hypothetical protein
MNMTQVGVDEESAFRISQDTSELECGVLTGPYNVAGSVELTKYSYWVPIEIVKFIPNATT